MDARQTGFIEDLSGAIPVTSTQMCRQNRLAVYRRNLRFAVAAHQAELRFDDPLPRSQPDIWECYSLSWKQTEVHVVVGAEVLALLMKGSAVSSDMITHTPETLGVLGEHFLGPLLDSLASDADGPVTLRSVSQLKASPSADSGIWSTLHCDVLPDGVAPLVISTTDDTVDVIIAQLENATKEPEAASNARAGIPQCLSRRTPGFAVPMADLRQFVVGDVMALDGRWSEDTPSHVWLNDSHLAICTRDETGAYALDNGFEPVTQGDAGHERTHHMDDAVSPMTALTDLPITLSIELDRVTRPLSEVENLCAGATLAFSEIAPDIVRVLANGRPFAEGKLVRMDAQMGVRITRMA